MELRGTCYVYSDRFHASFAPLRPNCSRLDQHCPPNQQSFWVTPPNIQTMQRALPQCCQIQLFQVLVVPSRVADPLQQVPGSRTQVGPDFEEHPRQVLDTLFRAQNSIKNKFNAELRKTLRKLNSVCRS